MLGRSALLAATNSENYGNWLGNYSDVSLLLRGNGIPAIVNPPVDESPTPKTITAVGNASVTTAIAKWNQGSGGSSLAFDGNGDRFDLAPSSAWDFSGGPHTIECWVYVNDYPHPSQVGTRVLMAGPNSVASSFVFLEISSSGSFGAGRPLFNSTGIGYPTAFPLHQWVHYALVLNGATTRMFVNGVGVTASVTMPTSTSGNSFYIGFDPTNSGVDAQFNGYIDDLRITKGVARYTSDFTPPTDELPANITDDPSYNSVSLLLRNGTQPLLPFDESPTPKTITAVGNASATTAIARWNRGSGGSSLTFDGSGDYLSISSNADFAFAGDFTVEAWGYLSSAPSTANAAYLTDFRNASAGNAGFTFGVIGSSGNARMYGASVFASVAEATGSTNISLNAWNHLAYVRSGSTVTMYLNGVSQGSLTSSFSQATTPLIVGARFNTLTEYWHGYIDDLRITKGIARYTSNFTPPTAQLPANITDDSSYNSVSLLLRNGTPLLVPLDESPTPKAITSVGNASAITAVARWNQGSGGRSLAFDGSGDYLAVPSSTDFSFPSSFTIELWVRFAALPAVQVIIAGASGTQLFLSTQSNGLGLRFGLTGVVEYGTGSFTWQLNTWYHVALVRNVSNVRMYVDGTDVTTGTITNSTSYSGSVDIGYSYGGGYFNGYIDDLRITKGVARYTSNFAPPPAELPNF